MADLPSKRVYPIHPFMYTGMDCFGPFFVMLGRGTHKRYSLLLTCLCSRAVQVKMLKDMTNDYFINALRCFIAIRGTVRQLRLAQGSNVLEANIEIKPALKKMDFPFSLGQRVRVFSLTF